jgi:hypothetical protein
MASIHHPVASAAAGGPVAELARAPCRVTRFPGVPIVHFLGTLAPPVLVEAMARWEVPGL